jgi:hypothetical protein
MPPPMTKTSWIWEALTQTSLAAFVARYAMLFRNAFRIISNQ